MRALELNPAHVEAVEDRATRRQGGQVIALDRAQGPEVDAVKHRGTALRPPALAPARMLGQHFGGGEFADGAAGRAIIGQGAGHIGPVGPPHHDLGTHQNGVAQIGTRQIGPGQVGTGHVRAPEAGLFQIGPDHLAVLHDGVGEVRRHGHDSGQLRALQIGPDQTGPLGLGIGARLGLDDPEPQFGVGGGDRAFTQIGLEQVGTGEVRPAQAGTAQIGAAQAGVDQQAVLHVRAEKGGIVEFGPGQIGTDQAGGGEVGVGQVAAPERQTGKVQPGQDRTGSARLGLPQAVVPGADGVQLGLIDAPSGSGLGGIPRHSPDMARLRLRKRVRGRGDQ